MAANSQDSGLSTQDFFWWREALGAALVLISRILTAPKTPWENDEFLFAEAVRKFDPSNYHPHPPGYPLFVLLGKLFMIIVHDPWRALVIVNVVAAPIGFIALARAFRNWIDDADLAVASALLYYFSASMLVHGTLALSDGVAVAFLSLVILSVSEGPGWVGGAQSNVPSAARPARSPDRADARPRAVADAHHERARDLRRRLRLRLADVVPAAGRRGGRRQQRHRVRDQAGRVRRLARRGDVARHEVRRRDRGPISPAPVGLEVPHAPAPPLRGPRHPRIRPTVARASAADRLHRGAARLRALRYGSGRWRALLAAIDDSRRARHRARLRCRAP